MTHSAAIFGNAQLRAGRDGQLHARAVEPQQAVDRARPHCGPTGRAVLDELIGTSDVFLTNYLPDVRAKLRLTADDVRRSKADIVYALATGPRVEGTRRGQAELRLRVGVGPGRESASD